MNNPLETKAFLKALDNFDAKQKALKGSKAAKPDVCATYKQVKPILLGITPFLSLIPVVGTRVVTAITALTAALDIYCPTA